MGLPPVRWLSWKRAWRIIPTLYPEEPLYAAIAERGQWHLLFNLERFTNRGVRQELGERLYLRDSDRLPKGKSAYNIGRPYAMPTPSRFSAGKFGVYYAARDLLTAVLERTYHTERFMASSAEPPQTLKQRVLVAQIRASFHDLRHLRGKWAPLYRLDDYSESQKLGTTLWKAGSQGIVYDSVRHAGGECVGVFSPQMISHCRQDRCLQFEWDGKKITHKYEIREFVR